ncbi:MAG: hypothetical protein K6E30_09100 [Lachnospiraceae bacterium]|nr:hypothetical protein [Lachnospiraceae bacterium]
MNEDRFRYQKKPETEDRRNKPSKKSADAGQRKARRKRKRIQSMLISFFTLAALVLVFLVLIHLTMNHIEKQDRGETASSIESAAESVSLSVSESVHETPSPTPTPTAPPEEEDSFMVKTYGKWKYSTDETAPEGDIVPVDYTVYSYEMLQRDIYFLTRRYSEYCEAVSLDTTADGREILDVVIGNKDAEKDIIIQYTIHAREYINTQLGMCQLEALLKAFSAGESVNGLPLKEIFSDIRLHMIPMMNPDGVTLSQFGFDSVRSEELKSELITIWGRDNELGKGDPDPLGYCSRWKANMRGVDLNRNFDVGWETTGGSANPSCTRYKGPTAASEIETQALVKLAQNVNCIGQIAYHSEGNVVYWDYGTEGELKEKDSSLADVVSNITGYKKTSTIASEQNLGGCSDYFILKLGIPSITVETGDWYDWPGDYEGQWPTIYAENIQVVPNLAAFFHGLS